jgi:uncharacterized protein YebE (UPF0316 family)
MEQVLAGAWGPALIFLLRICDVSIATLRLLSMVRGRKLATMSLAFFEVLIWVTAVGAVVQHLSEPLMVVGYAAGFAAGTFVGMTIEERLALGFAEVRVVTRSSEVGLAGALRDLGFGVTEMRGRGREGPVRILTTIVQRRAVEDLVDEVRRHDPEAFVTVEEPRRIERGWLLTYRRR